MMERIWVSCNTSPFKYITQRGLPNVTAQQKTMALDYIYKVFQWPPCTSISHLSVEFLGQECAYFYKAFE